MIKTILKCLGGLIMFPFLIGGIVWEFISEARERSTDTPEEAKLRQLCNHYGREFDREAFREENND